jgi:uncharacterized protein YjbJ (UPF0337 family)
VRTTQKGHGGCNRREHEEAPMGEFMDKLKSKMRQIRGAVSDERKQAEGVLDEQKGRVKERIEEVKEDIHKPPR